MNLSIAADELKALRIEGATLAPSKSSRDFIGWRAKSCATLVHALGFENLITSGFTSLNWSSRTAAEGSPAYRPYFLAKMQVALGLIDAAIFEVDVLLAAREAFEEDSVDPDLWAFVSADVVAESWGKAVTQACLYLEDHIRKWAGRPPEEVGERLMTTVFGESGVFRLGVIEAEKNGWHRFAMGISLALRNPSGHRIFDRPDHKRYAMGVISSCSLLITQLKFEHGNHFH